MKLNIRAVTFWSFLAIVGHLTGIEDGGLYGLAIGLGISLIVEFLDSN